MNLRETLEKNQYIGYGIGGILILIAVVTVFVQAGGYHGLPPGVSTRAFYTTEDQLTGQAALDALFVDDVNRVPPFDHNGKPAYLAIVLQCNGGHTRWVNTLQRWKASAKSKVESLVAEAVANGARTRVAIGDDERSLQEVKSPGPGPWVPSSSPAGIEVEAPKIPAGYPADDLTNAVP
jgi:hypothetical protein